MAGDHADVPFLQATDYTKGRPDGPPLWIVIHTMEEAEAGDTAERVAQYFHNGSGDRSVSAHYTVDADSAVQCVRLGDVAWTVGNRPGNYRGINYESAGTASQSAAQWADAYSQATLRRVAVIAARDMARYGIPAHWCTVEDLQNHKPGLTTHNDLRRAFGGTTHTDPGPNFPFAQFLTLVKDALTGDDMSGEIADKALRQLDARNALGEVYLRLSTGEGSIPGQHDPDNKPYYDPNNLKAVLTGIKVLAADVAALKAAVAALAGKDFTDESAIVKGVLATLTPQAIAAAIPDGLAAAVADELAARLQG